MNTDHASALELIRGAEAATLRALSGDDAAAGEARRQATEAARLLAPTVDGGPCQRGGCLNRVVNRTTGRRRLYCCDTCQQAAYWARKANAA
ncbi:hypothetical protein PUR61_14185 [Streptomyces sp. BE20]|uniref:hypothetical protein n=1 Tax=Streptomyces sp. BE20 TaxID=3002525 RepID=UPI002E76CD63|nr:hypothetical protein [Streptomyces sp. BE20]MEE1823330.1 hypothetical protein [Streptomyces sp. BE20]